jgi:hypothetical protein
VFGAHQVARWIRAQGFHLGMAESEWDEMNSMSAKTFIDTNVLSYAHDTDAGAKHQNCKSGSP